MVKSLEWRYQFYFILFIYLFIFWKMESRSMYWHQCQLLTVSEEQRSLTRDFRRKEREKKTSRVYLPYLEDVTGTSAEGTVFYPPWLWYEKDLIKTFISVSRVTFNNQRPLKPSIAQLIFSTRWRWLDSNHWWFSVDVCFSLKHFFFFFKRSLFNETTVLGTFISAVIVLTLSYLRI